MQFNKLTKYQKAISGLKNLDSAAISEIKFKTIIF